MSCKESMKKASLQVWIVGFLAFCGPGLFNALSGLGGAGSNDPKVAAIMNGTLYAFFTVVGYFSGVFFNLLGPKPLFFFGGLTYAIYALCAYYSDKGEWVGAIGGSLLGCGAGLFWTAQGAIMMAYATPNEKGAYIRNFWIVFNLGGVFGGILTMALNWNNTTATANPASYFTFIGLMVLGSFTSLVLLAPPNTVIKSDGSPVIFERATSAKEEIIAACKAIGDPFVVKMILFFFASNWFYTYEFGGYNNMLFNVRSRGLNSGLFWGAQMIGATLTGMLTDRAKWTMRRRGEVGFFFNCANLVVAWGSAFIVNFTVKCADGSGWDKGEGACGYDLVDDGIYAGLLIVYMLMGMQDAVFQSFCYWLMSAAAGGNLSRNVKYAACYKGIQSFGACVAWLTDLIDSFSYEYQLYFGTALSVIASIPTWWALDHIVEAEDYEDAQVAHEEGKSSAAEESSCESDSSYESSS